MERIGSHRSSAAKRGLKFEIDAEHIEQLFLKQNGVCAISGLPLVMDFKGRSPTASLDRIESHRGYVVGNVQWVHKVINVMKMDQDEAYFVAMCKQIAAHRGGAEPLSAAQRKTLAGEAHRSRDELTRRPDFIQRKPTPPEELHSVGGMLF